MQRGRRFDEGTHVIFFTLQSGENDVELP
jgi:hypothetical protein